jgi:hypothetical protein
MDLAFMSRIENRLVDVTSLHGPAPLQEIDNHDDDGKYQQDVDQPSHRIACHQSQQPQYQQYHYDCPKHMCFLSGFAQPLPLFGQQGLGTPGSLI